MVTNFVNIIIYRHILWNKYTIQGYIYRKREPHILEQMQNAEWGYTYSSMERTR